MHPDDKKAIETLYGRKKRNPTLNPLLDSQEIIKSKLRFKNKRIESEEKSIFYFVTPFNFSSMTKKYQDSRPKTKSSTSTTSKTTTTTTTPKTTKTTTKATTRFNFRLAHRTFQPNFPAIFSGSSTGNIDLCLDGHFDAISLLSDGNMYIFKEAYVFKYDSSFVMDRSYPKLIKTVFRGWDGSTLITLPFELDTVLHVPSKSVTYFFKDDLYWRSSQLYELDPGYPKKISSYFKGLDKNNGFGGKLDASFIWSGNGRIYFVEGNNYWRFDDELGKIEHGYPKLFDSTWQGLPRRITDAFQWVNSVTYFFVGDEYYRFDDLNLSVHQTIPAYPRKNNINWFGCEARTNKLSSLSEVTTQMQTTNSTKSLMDILVENLARETISNAETAGAVFDSTTNTNLARNVNRNETRSNLTKNKIYHENRTLNGNVLNRSAREVLSQSSSILLLTSVFIYVRCF